MFNVAMPTGLGRMARCDDTDSQGEGLRKHTEGMYRFFDRSVKVPLPSGAHWQIGSEFPAPGARVSAAMLRCDLKPMSACVVLLVDSTSPPQRDILP